MDEKKQIEEMAAFLWKNTIIHTEDLCHDVSETLVNEGYRKQSEGEWIRYPHNSGIYCSLCKRKRRYRDIRDAFCPNCGAKMKGGAE